MSRFVFALLIACKGPIPTPTSDTPTPTVPIPTPPPSEPANFGEFYADFQDKVCDIAENDCGAAYDFLDCEDRTTVPACTDFDPVSAASCLEGTTTCDSEILSSARVCDVVCSDIGFAEIGQLESEVCNDMLACDDVLATYTDSWTATFNGPNDPTFGPGGSCFEDSAFEDCEAACSAAYGGMQAAAHALVTIGDLPFVPDECGGTGTLPTDPPTPATPVPFIWTVTLQDGDGVSDSVDANDADTITTEVQNVAENYPDIVEWEFGIAQTGLPPSMAWLGEDCDGIDFVGADICHIFDNHGPMVLNRTFSPANVVGGSTTLIPVEFPVVYPQDLTFVIFGYDNNDAIVDCFTQGHNTSYYANCNVYTP